MSEIRIRVFVGSPADVVAERESLNTVVNELNRIFAALTDNPRIVLELVRWETHAFPAMGRAQEVVNHQIGEYEIFIGILWKRFGTPTGRAQSGTEEEFRLAHSRSQLNKRPHIMFYFSRQPFPPPRSLEEVEQLMRVTKFRSELESLGLVWDYASAEHFPDTIRPHLAEVVGLIVDPFIQRPAGIERRESAQRAGIDGHSELPTAGEIVRITDIGPGDAWRNERYLIGCIGRLLEAFPQGDNWYRGTVLLDPKPRESPLSQRSFAQFRFERA